MDNNKICIIGMGYVGLPLAVAFAKNNKVVCFDVDANRINDLKLNVDITLEVSVEELRVASKNLSFTDDISLALDCKFYIVTVPTPIDSMNMPILTPLIEASKSVGSVLRANDIVIYESTVYPGVTEEVCAPCLERASGLKFNQDFFCGYSPERINPGDRDRTVTNIPKVTSGSTPEIGILVDNLYKSIVTVGTHLVSSIRVAEASKVIENTQRDVNIALINEFSMIFNEMGINTHEVLSAAATKWNFIDLKPGLVGGHCIGVDPYYLTFKSEQVGYKPDLILTARKINNGMSKFISDQTVKEMSKVGKCLKDSRILILGVTFKENCPDMRNTKVLEIVQDFQKLGIDVYLHDPWADLKKLNVVDESNIVQNLFTTELTYDAIVLAVGHEEFKRYTPQDFKKLSRGKKVLIDVKNISQDPTWTL